MNLLTTASKHVLPLLFQCMTACRNFCPALISDEVQQTCSWIIFQALCTHVHKLLHYKNKTQILKLFQFITKFYFWCPNYVLAPYSSWIYYFENYSGGFFFFFFCLIKGEGQKKILTILVGYGKVGFGLCPTHQNNFHTVPDWFVRSIRHHWTRPIK